MVVHALAEATNGYQAELGFSRGREEFIGTQQDCGSYREERDDALRVYDELRGIAGAGKLERRDVAEVWFESRSRWRRDFAVFEARG